MGNDILNADVGNSTKDFNPRSLVGNDDSTAGNPAFIPLFQSTFPRGERLKALTLYSSDCYFNPRSLVGNDSSAVFLFVMYFHISIHVPSWGTTVPFTML